MYIFYISVPSEDKDKYPAINENLMHYTDDGYLYGLYAYTNDKKIAKSFKNERKQELFSLEVVETDDFGYIAFCKKYPWQELDYRKYRDRNGEKYEIISTRIEAYLIVSNPYKLLTRYLNNIVSIDYSIFNKEVIEILSNVGYTELFDILSDMERDPDLDTGMDPYCLENALKLTSIIFPKDSFYLFSYIYCNTFSV